MSETISETIRTPVAGRYDVIVAGGGPAGVSAAIAARRAGARTLLVESAGCLGGVWTAGMLAWIFDMQQGLGLEILDRLGARNARVLMVQDGPFKEGKVNCTYDIESMKLVLDQMVGEAGVDVLLHTRVVAASVEDSRIRAVMTESKSGRQAWKAHAFIDATGDGDLGALAGNGFDMGSRDGQIQPMTYMALMAVPSAEAVADCVSFWQGGAEHGPRLRNFRKHLDALGIDPSYAGNTLFHVRDNLLALMINHEYGVDATDAAQVTSATLSGRAEVNEVVDALRGSDGPFGGSYLAATAEYIGVREARRLHGRYVVTVEDLKSGRRHEDAVAHVRFGVDIHHTSPDKGKGNTNLGIKSKPYDIPYRALLASDVDGLLMAGRCISGDWVAFSSYRVTGEAVAMGQAAGTAAALAAETDALPHELPWERIEEKLPR